MCEALQQDFFTSNLTDCSPEELKQGMGTLLTLFQDHYKSEKDFLEILEAFNEARKQEPTLESFYTVHRREFTQARDYAWAIALLRDAGKKGLILYTSNSNPMQETLMIKDDPAYEGSEILHAKAVKQIDGREIARLRDEIFFRLFRDPNKDGIEVRGEMAPVLKGLLEDHGISIHVASERRER